MKKLNIIPFVDIFDTALATPDVREFKPRDYIYASEIGLSMYDRYLSMKGVVPSNLPNEIAIRKFKMGYLIEDFFKIVLFQVGLLHKEEIRVKSGFDNMLEVSGRLDVIYGGKIEVKKIDDFLENFKFLTFIGYLSKAINQFIASVNIKEFDKCGIEIKSCSDYMYNLVDSENKGQHHHLMQTFHYAYYLKMPFQLIYFDKNNGRMKSFWVMPNDTELLKMYMEDIKAMTQLYNANIIPEKEKVVVYRNSKFYKNWNIEYSKYLTHSYGFNTKLEYKDYATSIASRFNRVIDRINKKEKLTDNNKEVIREIKRMGFDIGFDFNKTEDIEHEVVEPQKGKKKLVLTENTSVDKLKNLL